MKRALQLEDLVSVESLQKVQDNFSAAVGIAMIMVNDRGEPVTEPSGFSAFCHAVRTSGDRRDQCYRCDDDGGRRALSLGEPSIYQCHCGLVDFAAPIIIRGEYLGAVIAGQVSLQDNHGKELGFISPPDDSWQQDRSLRSLRDQIVQVSYDKLRSAAYAVYHLAAYMVHEGYTNAVTQELHAKNLRLMEDSRRRLELEKSLREAQLQALAYQVNPHFLFNVLNTIGRLALKERAPQTESLLYAFADMMRYILKKSRSQILSLSAEVGHVTNYLNIQKVRMGDRFTFKIDIPARYDEVLCPFMVLHPIVENCINYAIEVQEEGGVIEISARDDGKDLILDVVDNGDGIDPETLRDVLAGVSEHEGRTSIGLHNVDSRLKHFFGPGYGLKVESRRRPGEGTRVQMRFPLEFDPCGI